MALWLIGKKKKKEQKLEMEKQEKLEESMKLLEAHSFAELMRNFIEYSDEDLPPMMRSLEELEAKMKAIAPPLFPISRISSVKIFNPRSFFSLICILSGLRSNAAAFPPTRKVDC